MQYLEHKQATSGPSYRIVTYDAFGITSALMNLEGYNSVRREVSQAD
jgi:hypothetical protein